MSTHRIELPRWMLEDDLLDFVLDAARLGGWLVHHDRRSDRALQQGHSGFPDLVLVRDRLLYRELKTETGRLSEAQRRWRDRLLEAGADWELWRPSDSDRIIAQLLDGDQRNQKAGPSS